MSNSTGVLPPCTGGPYDGVVAAHTIEADAYNNRVLSFTNPALPSNQNLTAAIEAVIAQNECGFMIYFNGDPNNRTSNNEIALGNQGPLAVHYSVALFKNIRNQYPNCIFAFNKAASSIPGEYDIIFQALDVNRVVVGCFDMSAGAP